MDIFPASLHTEDPGAALSWRARVTQEALRMARLLGIAPGRCRLCGRAQGAVLSGHDAGLGLCQDCAAALPFRSAGHCSCCGELFEREEDPPRRCGACLAHPPPYSSVLFHGVYDGALQDAIIQYKYHGRHAVERLLQELLLQRYTLELAASGTALHDCIVPMPLHPARLRERGFNQSLELARPLARRWRIALLPAALVRARRTTPQAGLSRNERQENVRHAFLAPRPELLVGRRVLLVDDVMTTGATAAEAARSCLAAGALKVDCCMLARA
ncbi:phosphoribosyltransferase family protein [Megalodesulfovibrio paquesii]